MSGTTIDLEDASVLYRSSAHVRATGDATDAELLALIKKKAPDPSAFEKNPPFTWQAEASNGKMDAYYTRMDDKSLRNYAKDADAGVMFLDSHDKRQLGFGQSVRGQFVAADGTVDAKAPDDRIASRVLIDFYTVPGIQLGRASSDSFITGVQTGIIRDVSIGFIPGAFECNICKNDPFDWWSMDCMHIPGAYYDSTGKNVVTSKSLGAVQAFAWVRDARLSEVSAVFDGATPGAYIQKAKFLTESGDVSRATATILERQLRIKLPERAFSVPMLGISDGKLFLQRGEEVIIDGARYHEGMEIMPKTIKKLQQRGEDGSIDGDMPPNSERPEGGPAQSDQPSLEEPAPTPPSQNSNRKREESPAGVAASAGGITSPAHAGPEDLRMNEDQIREMRARVEVGDRTLTLVRQAFAAAGIEHADSIDPVEGARELQARIADLTTRAKMGDDWRTEVIAHAIESGVRAEGNDFDADGWRETFGPMTPSQIRRLGDTWERAAVASGKLPAGGQRTRDGVVDEAQRVVDNVVRPSFDKFVS